MNFNFNKNGKLHEPLKIFEFSDGNFLCMYQGNRGYNPELDFVIKYKTQKTRLRTPSHTHWIVDLILKCEYNPNAVKSYVSEWLEIYDLIQPFDNSEERKFYNLIYNEYFKEKYDELENVGVYSIEFLSALIELFIKCEKQTPEAYMFKNILVLIKQYCNNEKDFYQVISHSKRV